MRGAVTGEAVETGGPSYMSASGWHPGGTVVMAFYADGATLGEVRVTHPLAVVDAVEGPLVDAR